jgi:chromosome segregation protein
MIAPARLLNVRLQGFKSFAERTQVTFGPGISAVVGPNGSGKSNLADALRWALGEQGRALRSRKSEDVIWAGSERRAAVGMADVQLTLDNADGLLSVDYRVVELGRRLYRSGENEYLLNRQRVRLRDLVDLLDSAHLAENAFLFIGQGMVDQALALRPEERRPLFEEVAGVRRHERRRRRAEEQLAEAEANITRVDDIVAELRPQVRRLGAQAEQQATRVSAGDELVAALLLAAHARWFEASARITAATENMDAARAMVDSALAELGVLESDASAAAAALDERARTSAAMRVRADEARAALTTAQLEDGRLASEQASLRRDRERLVEERSAAEADMVVQRRRLAEPAHERDLALESALAESERELAGALAELATLQAADQARDADAAAVRRAASSRAAEVEVARRRLADVERQAAEEAARVAGSTADQAQAAAANASANADLQRAIEAESASASDREAASAAWEQANAEAASAADDSAALATRLAAAKARRDALVAALEDDGGSGFAARMKAKGARRLDDGLVVDPGLRPAVDAALAGAARAYLTKRAAVLDHAGERGLAAVVDGPEGDAIARDDPDPRLEGFRERLHALGGGLLADALRRDGPGVGGRLLARAAWVADLQTALALQPDLPPGWVVIPRDGSAVVGEVVVRLGASEGTLERRAELERAEADLRGARQAAAGATSRADAARAAAAAARADLEAARAAEARASGERRAAEDAERVAARRLEAVLREAAWHAAQAERLVAEVERARSLLPAPVETSATPLERGDREALVTWQSRAAELRVRRDRLAGQLAEGDSRRRDAERRHVTAEAAIGLDEQRIAAADRGLASISVRVARLSTERDALAASLAGAGVREAETRAAIAALLAADAEDRGRLSAAERALVAARDRLRSAEDAGRVAEHRDLEARLGLEALREQLLVELAGLGELSRRHLPALLGTPPSRAPAARTSDDEEQGAADDAAGLAAALDLAGEAWAATSPGGEPPSPGRLAGLRRRYHELGAANPYAVDEYAALKARLAELEGQHADLRAAIDRTRALIAELNAMISEQFHATFRALEARFDARFRQLFGGGYARLSLTDPGDLAATGIEIVARPPGKKPQALAMLSGGERALTAVALLFAMLEVRPVPFCVLDEVDAALDEANVGRFTAALRELAAATQFVVITHNRGTIEIADALYGVTVGDDSVSRVVSLRLEEATEIADRVRGAGVAVGPGRSAAATGLAGDG